MSKRFIVEEKNIQKDEDILTVKGEEVHHINVLRYKVGDNVYINEYELNIQVISKDTLKGKIVGKLLERGVPKVDITLIQSYLKSDKMDYVVQKSVELGVKEIIPVISKNTVVKLEAKDKIKKLERLSKIAKEAIEQCGRTDSVKVKEVTNMSDINLSEYDIVFVCHETSSKSFKEIISNNKEKKKIAIVIGPEGGLDNKEVAKMVENNNAVDISLGERILRAETASLATLSIINYEFS